MHFFFLSPLHAFGTDVSVLRFSDYMDAGKWEVAKAVSSNYLVLIEYVLMMVLTFLVTWFCFETF